ncbi:MAG: 2-amino-4-hydroxy-6-hydroxymethyldihydropteridine diphosphokinase [Verrucomicrobiales bacterium]|nr:2-amino-4-hydroxy-6-hydroxymethyldihydropteridine diphosphokinase [Verrucomicrobiales bacterium]
MKGPGEPREAGSPVHLALGSNLGDSPAILRRAMDRLDALASVPVVRSSLWCSTPVDCPPGSPVFTNAVVGLTPRSGETPESLLRQLQALETEFGRRPKQILNEARPLDLDLIRWGDERRDTAFLVLPHPRAHLRRFVLAPLAELDPSLCLPGHTRTVAEWLELADPDPGLRRIPPVEALGD